jgi:uncharacterized membrane protein
MNSLKAPNPKSTASIAGHPLHPMLIPFPIALFVSVFVCDLDILANRQCVLGYRGPVAIRCGPYHGCLSGGSWPNRCLE